MKLALIIGFITLLLFSGYKIFNYGKDVQAGIEAQARQELRDTQAEKVRIIYKEKVKIEVRYRDKVKKIYLAQDPTGCIDRTLSAVGLLPATSNN